MGYVYAIRALGTPYVKIGVAEDVEARLAALQTGTPLELAILHEVEMGVRDYELEELMHTRYAEMRVRGEWFAVERGEELAKDLEAQALLLRDASNDTERTERERTKRERMKQERSPGRNTQPKAAPVPDAELLPQALRLIEEGASLNAALTQTFGAGGRRWSRGRRLVLEALEVC